MSSSRRIFLIVYPGFETLDLAGPMGVFSTASRLAPEGHRYKLMTASLSGDIIESGDGLGVVTEPLDNFTLGKRDTVLVVGATEGPLRIALENGGLTGWLADHYHKIGRVASVCSGAFFLAAAGILKDKRATCHWIATQKLSEAYPAIQVEPDALFVDDHNVWTSAGVSTGIDMALEMVRRDFGHRVSTETAQHLVVFAHRPGHQSQFSKASVAQETPNSRLKDFIAWLSAHLDQPLNVSSMATRAGMSARSFQRHFTDEVGMSPGAFLIELRLERAKDLLADHHSVGVTARCVGYRSEAAFRKAFEQKYGVSPSNFSNLHGRPDTN